MLEYYSVGNKNRLVTHEHHGGVPSAFWVSDISQSKTVAPGFRVYTAVLKERTVPTKVKSVVLRIDGCHRQDKSMVTRNSTKGIT